MPTSTAPQSFPSLYISVWVNRDPAAAYDFLHQPENFPRWATGLASGLRRATDVAMDRNEWIATGPEGESRVRFTARNDFGVVDHVVVLPDGQQIAIPLRVIGNGSGSEVVLTLFRLPDMSDEILARDADWVRRDLARLKALLEN
ncbi:MAG TPA: polyketide cyclase [Dongiaceae bacterium]